MSPGYKLDRFENPLKLLRVRRLFFDAMANPIFVFEVWIETSKNVSGLKELQINIMKAFRTER